MSFVASVYFDRRNTLWFIPPRRSKLKIISYIHLACSGRSWPVVFHFEHAIFISPNPQISQYKLWRGKG